MKNKFILKLLILIIASSLFFSCSNLGLFSVKEKEYNLKNISKNEILKILRVKNKKLNNLTAKLNLSYNDGREYHRTSGMFNYNKNHNFYLELYGIVGETELITHLKSDSFFVYNYYENFTIKDKIKSFSLNRIGGIDIDTDLFFTIISSRIINFCENSQRITILQKNEQKIVLEIIKDNNIIQIELNTKINPVSITIIKNQEKYFSIKLDYYFSPANNISLAKRMIFRKLNGLKKKMTLYYSSPIINQKFQIPNYRKLN